MIDRNETTDVTTGITQVEIIDTTAQTVTYEPPIPGEPDSVTGEPTTISVRPFTAEEVAFWDGYEAALLAEANESELRRNPQAHVDAILGAIAALGTIKGRTNATVNANPAATIKDVISEVQTIGRRLARLYRVDMKVLDSTDTGE
jgi:hypothetical protein